MRWFNAVSATETILTAGICKCFKHLEYDDRTEFSEYCCYRDPPCVFRTVSVECYVSEDTNGLSYLS